MFIQLRMSKRHIESLMREENGKMAVVLFLTQPNA